MQTLVLERRCDIDVLRGEVFLALRSRRFAAACLAGFVVGAIADVLLRSC